MLPAAFCGYLFTISAIYLLFSSLPDSIVRNPQQTLPSNANPISDPLLGKHHCNGYCPTSSKLHSWGTRFPKYRAVLEYPASKSPLKQVDWEFCRLRRKTNEQMNLNQPSSKYRNYKWKFDSR